MAAFQPSRAARASEALEMLGVERRGRAGEDQHSHTAEHQNGREKFEPQSHALGWTITNICSLIMLLLLCAAIAMDMKKKMKTA